MLNLVDRYLDVILKLLKVFYYSLYNFLVYRDCQEVSSSKKYKPKEYQILSEVPKW